MKKYLLILAFLFNSVINAQSQFEQFINYVSSRTDSLEKAAAVDSFMNYARSVGIPLIEGSTANFFYRGNAGNVTLSGDFNYWDTFGSAMSRLNQTNFWYVSEKFAIDARVEYRFILDGVTWIADPENPHYWPGPYGPNSEVSMPEYVPPWEVNNNSTIKHGFVQNISVYSSNVGLNYQIGVYLPPGYDSGSDKTYPTVYFQDGDGYLNLNYGRVQYILDNLLDSAKIEPVIGVFVTPHNRNDEYQGYLRDQYRLFFVNELVPYIDSKYKTIQDPKKRLVLGDSFGGNISVLISYNHPEVFGLCGSESGAFWPNNYEAYNLIADGPVKNIEWFSVWGLYDPLYEFNRSFRDLLISKSYNISWLEKPEGHNWGFWRAYLDTMFEYFFPGNATAVSDERNLVPSNFTLYQNYPNPFNPATTISYSIPTEGKVIIKVFNLLGREVAELVNEEKGAGSYQVSFNASSLSSGVYFYRIRAGDFVQTKKMILLK